MVDLYNGIVFTHENRWSADTTTWRDLENIMLSERSQFQKTTHCVVPFMGNVKNRQEKKKNGYTYRN